MHLRFWLSLTYVNVLLIQFSTTGAADNGQDADLVMLCKMKFEAVGLVLDVVARTTVRGGCDGSPDG
jgi:hypothetical protein